MRRTKKAGSHRGGLWCDVMRCDDSRRREEGKDKAKNAIVMGGRGSIA